MNIEQQTPRELLQQFYIDNNLGLDGGQKSSSVKIELTPNFNFYFPNFDARREAVIKHDIHHLLTGYDTSIIGESEISTWEIASGCKKYWAAFLIDTSGVMVGLPFSFPRVFKAFARGRRTKNLYHDIFSNETALDMKISELREVLNLNHNPKNIAPNLTDVILFTLFVFYGAIYSILLLVTLPLLLLYSIYIGISNRKLKL
jgi:hypothetical protein